MLTTRAGSGLSKALIEVEGTDEESIKNLRRAICSQLGSPSSLRRASTPPSLRPTSELLFPEVGRALQDKAQPGGFGRQVSDGYWGASLDDLLSPETALPFLEPPWTAPNSPSQCQATTSSANLATNLATAVVIGKSVFGLALLIVPHGMLTAGAVGGTMCLVGVYLLMLHGMLMLIDCSRAFGGNVNFMDLGHALGSWGQAYISGAVMVLSFGFNCIWCVSCAQNISMVLPQWGDGARMWLFFPFVAPLCLVRRLKFFTVTNLVGIALCSGTCVYLTVLAAHELYTSGPKEVLLFDTQNLDTLLWVGACGYIFELICVVLPIYDSAADKQAMPSILVVVTSGALCLYVAFGLLFYFAFGGATAELATLNLSKDSHAGVLFPVFFSVVGIVTMPLNSFVICQSYEPLVSWPKNNWRRKWSKNALRTLSLAAVYIVTWLGGQQLQNFLALVGGLLGANMSLVVPGALHLAICKPKGLVLAGDVATIIAGFAMMACSTFQAIATWK